MRLVIKTGVFWMRLFIKTIVFCPVLLVRRVVRFPSRPQLFSMRRVIGEFVRLPSARVRLAVTLVNKPMPFPLLVAYWWHRKTAYHRLAPLTERAGERRLVFIIPHIPHTWLGFLCFGRASQARNVPTM